MLPDQKLNALLARHAALERELAAAVPPETYVRLSREFAELAPVVEAVKSYRAAEHELEGVTSLMVDPATDPEMRSIAEAEKPELEDFGEILLRGNGGTGYIRVDWYTPKGLGTWGDGRVVILGTDGYIELRKYVDIAGHPGNDVDGVVRGRRTEERAAAPDDRLAPLDCGTISAW